MAKENPGKLFRLKWDNHLQNLSCLFESLYVQQKYVDVSLYCDGGQLKAHKVVLSACSSYFETIFKDHPCKHPTVIMQDVKLREMQMVLEYMYKGELNVLEEELNAFVSAASLLDVRGLSNNLPKDKDESAESSDPVCETAVEPNAMDHLQQFPASENGNGLEIVPLSSSNYNDSQNLNMGEISPDRQSTPLSFTDVLQDMLGRQSATEMNQRMSSSQDNQSRHRRSNETLPLGPDPKKGRFKEEYIPPASPVEILEIPDNRFEVPETIDEKIECSTCKLHFMTPSLLQAHLLDEHNYTEDYRPHRCDFCPLAFYRSAHLKRHRRLHTGEKPFSCEVCGKSFARQDKLKQHVQRHGPQAAATSSSRARVPTVGRPRFAGGRTSRAQGYVQSQAPFGDVSYLSSMSLASSQRQDASAEQLLRTVQDLGECIIQPCLPRQ